jgi:PAS domain S-box-containing protein
MIRGVRWPADVIEGALDGFVGIDRTGIITDWNPAAERIFGYVAGEAVGSDLRDLIIPERFHERHRSALERAADTGIAPQVGRRLALPGRTRAGDEIPVELMIHGVDGGRFFAWVKDLSARERERERDARRKAHAR